MLSLRGAGEHHCAVGRFVTSESAARVLEARRPWRISADLENARKLTTMSDVTSPLFTRAYMNLR